MKEKLTLLFVGAIVSVITMGGGYLLSFVFGSYETKADANLHKAMVVTELKAIKEDVKEMKGDVKSLLRQRETVLGAEPPL